MDQKKQTGFSLFPTPPTPPARRGRARTRSSSGGSSKLIKSRPTSCGHGRKASTTVADPVTPPSLVPAPLRIRKSSEDIPPLPKLQLKFPPSKQIDESPKTPESVPPQLPVIPQSLPLPLPRTPTRQFKPKTRTVAEFVELDAVSKKRASSRLSQWLDVEDGEVDRRRLSRYLGTVLDNTFEIPILETGSRASILLHRRVSKHDLTALAEQCECPSDAIICHCSSSPEFERFRSWPQHKVNSSISSTACLIGVPRARFQSAFFHIPEPIAELSSPPGLLSANEEDEDTAEALDWTTPLTPGKDDVFGAPSHAGTSYSSKYVIASPPSMDSSTSSRFQSFSRPFRPDSTYRSMHSDGSVPSSPTRDRSRSKHAKSGYLTSISTVSSFDFDFDFDFQLRRQSLAQRATDGESTHFRTDSNESFTSQTSQYVLSTATATVALSRSSIKPVLVNNVKKVRTPSSTSQPPTPNTPSTSAKSSASSFNVPDFWRQYDAGVRVRSRSTTVGTNATDESAALSAMLTIPLLTPKGAWQPDGPVPGNAFAQRSNTVATMPAKMPSIPSNELAQFEFGPTPPSPDQGLGRSNTTPNLNTYINSQVTDHVQAHANASARLRAFMNSFADTTDASQPDGNLGLGIHENPVPRRKKEYLCVDERVVNRDDSGVFGRMSILGVQLGGVPGRREFSEPQFFRCTDIGGSGSGKDVRP